ncbi:MCE family protein [Nocardioides speluncae]|uniref:MCE family protein n=1 Tax=Nocardioides speluncae TaxID=2670337 RepID=UPI000D69A951|nr:MCE family protein [Nocardioides speluncae]
MLVNIHHDSPQEHRRLVVAGIAFLLTIALLISLSIAMYQKVFEPVTMVTIKADRAGLQLAKFGDVRLNGALVGQVREIDQDGKEASIKIGLRPEAAREIPANVKVEILPTTLFGQKYIALLRPENPAKDAIADGDVIPSDRVRTNVELNRILADLFPLLRAVRPADLNATLNALATALGGRGERIGESLDKLDSYLGAIDDHLPTFRKDIRLLAQVAQTYDLAAPDLMSVLKNATVTSRTVIASKEKLGVFFDDLTGLSSVSTRILADNEQNLIRVGQVTEPVLQLLATYSPQNPCLLKGLAIQSEKLKDIFRGGVIHQEVRLFTPQYKAYTAADAPEYGEIGHGPWCIGLPNPGGLIGDRDLADGTDIDGNPPTSPIPGLPLPRAATPYGANPTSGSAGTEAEQELLNALLAAETGRPADSYGSLPALLYGPLVRGAK